MFLTYHCVYHYGYLMCLDLLRIEKTSGDVVRERMKCDINRVLIGSVSAFYVLGNLIGNCAVEVTKSGR